MPLLPPSLSYSFEQPPRGWLSLLARKAALMTPSRKADFKLLALAAKEGDEATVRRLLPRVGAVGWGAARNSPLAWAAGGGHAGCVEALLPASDPSRGNPDGESYPLLLAAFSGSPRCVELLLPHGDPKRADSLGRDALMAAVASSGQSAECVRLLLPHSDPGAKDRDGLTALARAAKSGEADCVAALLPHSDPGAVDHSGGTPLMHAARAMSVECVRLLLPVSDPHFKDPNGWSAHEIAKNCFSAQNSAILSLIEGWERAMKERQSLQGAANEAAPLSASRSARL